MEDASRLKAASEGDNPAACQKSLHMCLRLAGVLYALSGMLFTLACSAADGFGLANAVQLRLGLESGSLFVTHRAIQESVDLAITRPEMLPVIISTLTQSKNDNGHVMAWMELSRIGPRIVPRVIEEIAVLQPPSRRYPLMICLGRLGPEANAAIPVLANMLCDAKYDEEYQIQLRVILANMGYHTPGLLERIAADLCATNWISSRPMEGIAISTMANIGVREWMSDEITSQVIKLLKWRGGSSATAVITLGNYKTNRTSAIHALRELYPAFMDESSPNCVQTVLGFARYRIETENRESCLRNSLRCLGLRPDDGEVVALLVGIYQRLMDDELLQKTIEHLDDQEAATRLGAIKIMAGVGLPGRQAISRLLNLAKASPSEEERFWAIVAMGTMAGADVIPQLEGFLKSENSEKIKLAITESLKLIKGPE